MARICTPLVCGSRRENKSPIKEEAVGSADWNGWDRTLPCINLAVEELETHGWLVNQTRMWLSNDLGRTAWSGLAKKGKTAFFSTSLMVQEQLTALWVAMDNRNRLLKAVWVQQMASRKARTRFMQPMPT
ncbi:MAG: hypothetical protein Ct9H90mP5_03900 [Acidimicrobiaceae bacterium]|nr:MAG: hypothetical protein Ct9H90mP5_03900 [Acidimicrobiaceae bacterium]